MRVAIAGAGAVGRSIARELVENGTRSAHRTQPGHFDVDAIPAAHWLFGDACELTPAGADAPGTVRRGDRRHRDDKANVVLSLLAKTEFAVPRVVARVNDPRNEWLFDSAWGVDVAVSTPACSLRWSRLSPSATWCDFWSSARAMPTWWKSPLPDDTWRGRSARAQAGTARDVALVTILRGQRVIVPEPDQPLEGATNCCSWPRPMSRWTCADC